MDEEKKEYTLDDLEDIIREYSSRPQKSDTHDEPTVRIRASQAAVAVADAQETKRLADADEDVRIYRAPEKKKPDTPPEPIAFPQKNAQPPILEQLTQEAEQSYAKLDKNEPAKLRAQLLLHAILCVAAALTAFLVHDVSAQRQKLLILAQLSVMLLSAVVGYRRLLEGVMDMLRRRFRLNSLLAVTLLVCWLDALLCIKSPRLPFAAVFSLQMLMAQWAHYQKIQLHLSRYDTLRKASELSAVVKTPDYYRHLPAYQSAPLSDHYAPNGSEEESAAEKFFCHYALGVVVLGLVLAVVTGLLHGAAEGVRAYAAALLAATPASVYVCFCRPQATLEKRLHKLGTLLCLPDGVRSIEKQGYYPLTHRDLFPQSHVKLNGVRFYGERNPNTVVSYVSALMKADGGSLERPFEQLRASRNARVCKVEELTSYPGGVGGQIDGLSVIAGTLDFIESMGVELPEVSRIPHAVYAAVNQSLCAVFAVSFTRSKSSASGLRTLCDSGRVHPIMVDCDFVMSEEFLKQKLGVDVRGMHFPDCMTRMTLAEKTPPDDAEVIALTTRNGLAQRAYAVTGGAALRAAWRYGTLVHMLGGCIGFLAVTILALHGDLWLLEAYNLLLYGCVWMIPGLLLCEGTRTI